MEEIKKELVSFFIDAKKYQEMFKRKTYETGFKECYENFRPILDKVYAMYDASDNREETLDELSSAIPDYVHQKLLTLSKRKQEKETVDYNLLVVTFIIPAMVYDRSETGNALAEKLIEKWNQPPITLNIQKADFETLNGSFKTRPCYITTAVCEMQNKTENCYELKMLREYRDNYLVHQPEGELIVNEYYDIAPTIINRINKSGHAKETYSQIYETYLMPCISLIEEGELKECQRVYTDMVRKLQKKYLH